MVSISFLINLFLPLCVKAFLQTLGIRSRWCFDLQQGKHIASPLLNKWIYYYEKKSWFMWKYHYIIQCIVLVMIMICFLYFVSKIDVKHVKKHLIVEHLISQTHTIKKDARLVVLRRLCPKNGVTWCSTDRTRHKTSSCGVIMRPKYVAIGNRHGKPSMRDVF